MSQRRYNIALACSHADNGKPNFVEPVTKAELATRKRGVMSEALYSLPDDVFGEAVRVLATYAVGIDFWRHDCEDDSTFSTLDDLRAASQKHSVLGHVADAIERIEMERARELAKALDDPWLDAVQAERAEKPGWRSLDFEALPLRKSVMFQTTHKHVFMGTFEGYGTANDVHSFICTADTMRDTADDVHDTPVFFRRGEHYNDDGDAIASWSYIPDDLLNDQTKALDKARFDAAQSARVEALRRILTTTAPPSSPPTCNKHTDCDAADAAAHAEGERGAVHCHDDCCEDCFGS